MMHRVRAITLRNLPPELERRVEAEARARGWSLNRTVIRLLEQQLLPEAPPLAPRRHRDLDRLAGSWTAEEAAEFDRSLTATRKVDPELWD